LDHLNPAGGGMLAGTELAASGLYQVQHLKKAGAGTEALLDLPSPLKKIKDILDGGLLDLFHVINNMPPQEGDTDIQNKFRWIVSTKSTFSSLPLLIISWIANLYPTFSLQAWGIDTSVRAIKFFTGKAGFKEEEAKQINVVTGCVATGVDSYLRFGISAEEYLKTAKQKKSFVVLMIQTFDIGLRMGAMGAETVEVFAKDPDTVGTALIVRQGLTYGRTAFKALWYLIDKYHFPS
jgi:hypothetical protein